MVMLKKITIIAVMFTLLSACLLPPVTAVAAEGIAAARTYLHHGTFDEPESPSPGVMTGTRFYAGWSQYAGSSRIVSEAESPFASGKALLLEQSDEAYSSVQYKANDLADISAGADYTDTRAIEMDFQFDGQNGNGSVNLLFGMLLLSANKNNKTATLYLYCGEAATGGPGPNYTVVKNDITLGQPHHVKLIYRLVDIASPAFEHYSDGGGYARTVALYIDGEKLTSSYIGSYIFYSVNPNYLYDSQGSADRLNNGMSTAPDNYRGFRIGFSGKSSGGRQSLWIDNVEYYGLPYNLHLLDENNCVVTGAAEAERLTRYHIDVTAQDSALPIRLFSGFYDTDGRLLRLEIQKTVTPDSGRTASLQVPVSFSADLTEALYEMRSFLWATDDLQPLCVKSTVVLSVSEGYEKTLDRLHRNMVKPLYDTTAAPDAILAKLQEDGSFSDLNYADERRSAWDPATHFGRLYQLCQIYSTPHNPYADKEGLVQITEKSLRWWLDHDPPLRCKNWWFNDVQIPTYCYQILLLDHELSADLRQRLEDRVLESDLLLKEQQSSTNRRSYNRNGSAVPRAAAVTIGLLLSAQDKTVAEKVAEIQKLLNFVNQELLFEATALGYREQDGVGSLSQNAADYNVYNIDTECIKADYSYQEHENMLHPAGYGWGFLSSADELLGYIKGTCFDLSRPAKEKLSNLLLDGFQWMGYKNYWDTTVLGRGVAEKSNVHGNSSQSGLLRYLLEDDSIPRRSELSDRLARERYPHTTENLTGNRYFWQSDFISHNRTGYHFSVKTSSWRTRTSEGINGQNQLGVYLSDGALNLVKNGLEYSDLAPVWDWNKLPGTTTEQGKTAAELKPDRSMGATPVAGGVSDGLYGLSMMDYSRFGVGAKKSTFCFDDEIVLLGAGITAEGEGNIYTALNQCHLNGDVLVKQRNQAPVSLSSGRRQQTDVEWVLHDGVGYLTEGTESLELANERVTGSWSRVDTVLTGDAAADVFLLGIDHGQKPQNGTYRVILLPETNQAALEAYENPITVLENSPARQLVWHNGLSVFQGSFYQAGTATLPNGETIAVDSPCALMVRFFEDGYRIFVSNPENQALEATVTVSGRATHFAEGIGHLGNDAGKTYHAFIQAER